MKTNTVGLLQRYFVSDFQNTKGSLSCKVKFTLLWRVEWIALCVPQRPTSPTGAVICTHQGKILCLLWWCAQKLKVSWQVIFNYLSYLSGRRIIANWCFIDRNQGEKSSPNTWLCIFLHISFLFISRCYTLMVIKEADTCKDSPWSTLFLFSENTFVSKIHQKGRVGS